MLRGIIATYRAAFSGLPRDIWMLSLVALINRAGSMVLPFIGLYLTADRGMPIPLAGRILALYGVGSAVGAYLGGWLTDRIGSMRTQQLSLYLSGVGFLIFSQLRGVVAISIGIFVLSIVAELFRPAVMIATAERSPQRLQARSFALLRLAVNLGVGVGPAIGGFLALYNYFWLFAVDAATCWAAAILLPLMVAPAPAADPGASAELRPRSPWRDGPYLSLMLLVMFVALVIFQVLSTLPLYLREVLGYLENTIGLCLAFNAALIVLFEMVLIHWAERHDRMMLVGVGAFLTCAGFALMPLGTSLPFILLTVAVWTFGEMLTLPLINAVVADRSDARSRGRYMGLYMMAFSMAFVIAPIAGTHVFQEYGPRVLWFGIGFLAAPLAVWSLSLRVALNPRPQVPEEIPGTAESPASAGPTHPRGLGR